MTIPPPAPLHLTATRIAEFFRFGCDRQLRFGLIPPELREAEILGADPARGSLLDRRTGAGLLVAAGRQWERRKLRQLLNHFGPERVRVAGWTPAGDPLRLPPGDVTAALREPGQLEFLVQPELSLADPARFARHYGWDADRVHLAPAAPDLIRIRRLPNGRLRFQVIDIKASREARTSHFAQVAFYTLLLEEICAAESISSGAPDTRWGRIWARTGKRPTRFALGAYRHHVERWLREDLPRLARTAPLECAWHLSPRCTGCGFLDLCQNEADRVDDLARVVGITPLAKQTLRAKGIHTTRELARSFRRDTFSGCHALESQATQLQQRAQAVSFGKVIDLPGSTHLMAPHEDVRVILTAEADPVTGICYALGVRAVSAGKTVGVRRTSQVFLASAGTGTAEREMLCGFLSCVDDLLRAIGEARPARDTRPVSAHFYLFDPTEVGTLRDLFERALTGPLLRPALARVLRVLFAEAEGAPGGGSRSAPGTVVADVVSSLFALPVPYAYDLAAVSACLTPTSGAWIHHPRRGFHTPFGSQIAFERIHEVWRTGSRWRGSRLSPDEVREEIRRTLESKLAAIDSIIRAVRERAARKERLQLRAEPFSPGTDTPPLADSTLDTLRVFTQMEAAAEALSLRALHALPPEDRARRFECIRGMELAERRPDGALVFTFDPECREAKFRPGDFNLVLTNDDGRSLLETDRQPWMRHALMAELVEYDLAADPPRLVLAPASGLARAEAKGWIDLDRRCLLDRAPADFNTRRVLSTLRHLADGHGEAEFVLGLLNGAVPDDWSPRYADLAGAWADTLDRPARLHGRLILNADQERAWRAAFERCATLVWGPPGTGKTYLLAWTLIGLAAAARREGKPCRVLVAAATHRAITNVLARVARELSAAGLSDPLRLVKLRGSGSDADAELAGSSVELVPDDHLPSLLHKAEHSGEPLIVGSTVWSLWKQMKAAGAQDETGSAGTPADVPIRPWFDVIVIDEASQIKVPEAVIALSAIRAGGQTILCGDDRQLAPVVRGRYPAEAGTLFGSVFGHFAAQFPKLALRESRRMNRALVEYPRQLFYPGLVSLCPEQRIQLVEGDPPADPVDRLFREIFLEPDDAVVFCTYNGVRNSPAASGTRPDSRAKVVSARGDGSVPVGGVQRNLWEAGTIARIARLARAWLVDPATGVRFTPEAFVAHGLAVISPHRAQNSAIRSELLAAGFAPDELPVIDTVERMQGNEREVILVSYAVADREYAEREAEFLLNPNRFNVSITRPRAKLVVLMSQAILDALPQDEAVLTGSMAIKGYGAHCADDVRDLDLPGPDGSRVRVCCRYRKLRG